MGPASCASWTVVTRSSRFVSRWWCSALATVVSVLVTISSSLMYAFLASSVFAVCRCPLFGRAKTSATALKAG